MLCNQFTVPTIEQTATGKDGADEQTDNPFIGLVVWCSLNSLVSVGGEYHY